MKKMRKLVITLFLVSAAASAAEPQVEKQESGNQVQEVVVEDTHDPLRHPYRAIWEGMDAFEKYHQLAPNASLRFRVFKNNDLNKYAIDTEGLSVRIAGDETSMTIPIAADGTFALPKNQAAFDENADLMLNKKEKLYGGSPEVRTPGIAANMRRLGDLRLECQVGVAIAKKEMNFFQRAAINVLVLGKDLCEINKNNFSYSVAAPGRLASATIVSGDRRKILPSRRYDFDAPIADQSWPDDALIEFEFADPPSLEQFAQQPIYLRGTMNDWGTANLLKQVNATTYSADIALRKGKHEFRIGSQDFKAIEYGTTPDNKSVALGSKKALADGGRKMSIEIDHAATFTFSLDVSNPEEPMLTVTPVNVEG